MKKEQVIHGRWQQCFTQLKYSTELLMSSKEWKRKTKELMIINSALHPKADLESCMLTGAKATEE